MSGNSGPRALAMSRCSSSDSQRSLSQTSSSIGSDPFKAMRFVKLKATRDTDLAALEAPARTSQDRTPGQRAAAVVANFAHYLPRWILEYLSRLEEPCLENKTSILPGTAVMCIDVVGFTALTGILSSSCTGDGAESISNVLNAYFDRVLEILAAFRGDVVQFAGDAIMAIFHVGSAGADTNCAFALKCAQMISASAGTATVDLLGRHVDISLKLGVAVGPVSIVIAGGYRGRWVLFAGGETWNDAATACQDCLPAHIVVHSSATKVLRKRGFMDGCFSGKQVLANRSTMLVPPFAPVYQQPGGIPDVEVSEDAAMLLRSFVPRNLTKNAGKGSAVSSRAADIRSVVTIFVKFCSITDATAGEEESLYEVAAGLQKSCHRYGGVCNKAMFDDKGLVALICFGLPQFVHADDSTRALNLAHDLISSLSPEVGGICIGISRGKVYCGELGNNFRAEYTVLGDSVNLASRLMSFAATRRDSAQPPASSTSGSDGGGSNPVLDGVVVVDETIYAEVSDVVVFEATLDIRVKGKTGTITAAVLDLPAYGAGASLPLSNQGSNIGSTHRKSRASIDSTATRGHRSSVAGSLFYDKRFSRSTTSSVSRRVNTGSIPGVDGSPSLSAMSPGFSALNRSRLSFHLGKKVRSDGSFRSLGRRSDDSRVRGGCPRTASGDRHNAFADGGARQRFSIAGSALAVSFALKSNGPSGSFRLPAAELREEQAYPKPSVFGRNAELAAYEQFVSDIHRAEARRAAAAAAARVRADHPTPTTPSLVHPSCFSPPAPPISPGAVGNLSPEPPPLEEPCPALVPPHAAAQPPPVLQIGGISAFDSPPGDGRDRTPSPPPMTLLPQDGHSPAHSPFSNPQGDRHPPQPTAAKRTDPGSPGRDVSSPLLKPTSDDAEAESLPARWMFVDGAPGTGKTALLLGIHQRFEWFVAGAPVKPCGAAEKPGRANFAAAAASTAGIPVVALTSGQGNIFQYSGVTSWLKALMALHDGYDSALTRDESEQFSAEDVRVPTGSPRKSILRSPSGCTSPTARATMKVLVSVADNGTDGGDRGGSPSAQPPSPRSPKSPEGGDAMCKPARVSPRRTQNGPTPQRPVRARSPSRAAEAPPGAAWLVSVVNTMEDPEAMFSVVERLVPGVSARRHAQRRSVVSPLVVRDLLAAALREHARFCHALLQPLRGSAANVLCLLLDDIHLVDLCSLDVLIEIVDAFGFTPLANEDQLNLKKRECDEISRDFVISVVCTKLPGDPVAEKPCESDGGDADVDEASMATSSRAVSVPSTPAPLKLFTAHNPMASPMPNPVVIQEPPILNKLLPAPHHTSPSLRSTSERHIGSPDIPSLLSPTSTLARHPLASPSNVATTLIRPSSARVSIVSSSGRRPLLPGSSSSSESETFEAVLEKQLLTQRHVRIELTPLNLADATKHYVDVLGCEAIDQSLASMVNIYSEGVPGMAAMILTQLANGAYLGCTAAGEVYLRREEEDISLILSRLTAIEASVLKKLDEIAADSELGSAASRFIRQVCVAGQAGHRLGLAQGDVRVKLYMPLLELLYKDDITSLLSLLNELVRRKILAKSDDEQPAYYVFQSALLPVVQYHNMLSSDRKDAHYQVALALERLVQHDRSGLLGDEMTVASHFSTGEGHEQALVWYKRALQRSFRQNCELTEPRVVQQLLVNCIRCLALAMSQKRVDQRCDTRFPWHERRETIGTLPGTGGPPPPPPTTLLVRPGLAKAASRSELGLTAGDGGPKARQSTPNGAWEPRLGSSEGSSMALRTQMLDPYYGLKTILRPYIPDTQALPGTMPPGGPPLPPPPDQPPPPPTTLLVRPGLAKAASRSELGLTAGDGGPKARQPTPNGAWEPRLGSSEGSSMALRTQMHERRETIGTLPGTMPPGGPPLPPPPDQPPPPPTTLLVRPGLAKAASRSELGLTAGDGGPKARQSTPNGAWEPRLGSSEGSSMAVRCPTPASAPVARRANYQVSPKDRTLLKTWVFMLVDLETTLGSWKTAREAFLQAAVPELFEDDNSWLAALDSPQSVAKAGAPADNAEKDEHAGASALAAAVCRAADDEADRFRQQASVLSRLCCCFSPAAGEAPLLAVDRIGSVYHLVALLDLAVLQSDGELFLAAAGGFTEGVRRALGAGKPGKSGVKDEEEMTDLANASNCCAALALLLVGDERAATKHWLSVDVRRRTWCLPMVVCYAAFRGRQFTVAVANEWRTATAVSSIRSPPLPDNASASPREAPGSAVTDIYTLDDLPHRSATTPRKTPSLNSIPSSTTDPKRRESCETDRSFSRDWRTRGRRFRESGGGAERRGNYVVADDDAAAAEDSAEIDGCQGRDLAFRRGRGRMEFFTAFTKPGNVRTGWAALLLAVAGSVLDGTPKAVALALDDVFDHAKAYGNKCCLHLAICLGRAVNLLFSRATWDEDTIPRVVGNTEDLLQLLDEPIWEEVATRSLLFMMLSASAAEPMAGVSSVRKMMSVDGVSTDAVHRDPSALVRQAASLLGSAPDPQPSHRMPDDPGPRERPLSDITVPPITPPPRHRFSQVKPNTSATSTGAVVTLAIRSALAPAAGFARPFGDDAAAPASAVLPPALNPCLLPFVLIFLDTIGWLVAQGTFSQAQATPYLLQAEQCLEVAAKVYRAWARPMLCLARLQLATFGVRKKAPSPDEVAVCKAETKGTCNLLHQRLLLRHGIYKRDAAQMREASELSTSLGFTTVV
ncbi:Adenylate cyclase 2 [Diplonema papillatum]|nr:Adenylate cyclase 2 [Diplonema papillatum]